MTELKPCPFCGGEARIREVSIGDYPDEFTIDCKNCAVDIGNFDTKEDAIKAWNKRTSPWQTGTPTEEGWYLFTYKHLDSFRYATDYYFVDSGWTFSVDKTKMLAWQKITPYEEN